MDYQSLLKLADSKQESRNDFLMKQNKKNASKGPSKEVIAAFKARREKKKMEELRQFQIDKEKLISLRAQSGKSIKRSRMMKTRTKDNDFSRSVMTAEMIEEQKLAEEEKKRKELAEKRANSMTRAKNKNKSETLSSGQNSKAGEEKKKRPPKAPPQLSYHQLLDLAAVKSEEKKNENLSLEEEIIKELESRKEKRPMTQQEKDRLKEELYYKMRAQKGLVHLPTKEERRRREDEKRRQEKKDLNTGKQVTNRQLVLNKDKFPREDSKNEDLRYRNKSPVRRSEVDIFNRTGRDANQNRSNSKLTVQPGPSKKSNAEKSKQASASSSRAGSSKSQLTRQLPSTRTSLERPPLERPSIKRDRARTPPPSPPLKRNLTPIGLGYRRGMYDDEDLTQYVADNYDEEEEEDDDMADFIDDGPLEEDYSKHIREIFGYDKRKYRNVIEEDIEESNFVQCMKEESRSARLGRQEDLEDMRKEEEEKRRKKLQYK